METLNPATRDQASRWLRALLLDLVSRGERVFAGFDFSFGYPAGLAAALGAERSRPPWEFAWNTLHGLLRDAPDNLNDRFEAGAFLNERLSLDESRPGPFWGCPRSRERRFLRSRRKVHGVNFPFVTRAGRALDEFRTCEAHLRERGFPVHSGWKLYAPGAVGSQSLLGIPRLAALRGEPGLRGVTKVWPFETGFTREPTGSAGPAVVFAEVWPPLLGWEAGTAAAAGRTKDEAQVRAMTGTAADLDGADAFGGFFLPGRLLETGESEAALREEGWILGA